MTQRRISDSPEPARPLNSGEPLRTIAARPRTFSSSGSTVRILSIRWSRNSIDPSETAGRPGPNRPLKPSCLCYLTTSRWEVFHSTPNGGLDRQ